MSITGSIGRSSNIYNTSFSNTMRNDVPTLETYRNISDDDINSTNKNEIEESLLHSYNSKNSEIKQKTAELIDSLLKFADSIVFTPNDTINHNRYIKDINILCGNLNQLIASDNDQLSGTECLNTRRLLIFLKNNSTDSTNMICKISGIFIQMVKKTIGQNLEGSYYLVNPFLSLMRETSLTQYRNMKNTTVTEVEKLTTRDKIITLFKAQDNKEDVTKLVSLLIQFMKLNSSIFCKSSDIESMIEQINDLCLRLNLHPDEIFKLTIHRDLTGFGVTETLRELEEVIASNGDVTVISNTRKLSQQFTTPFSKKTYKHDGTNLIIAKEANHSTVEIKGDSSIVENHSMTTDIKIRGNDTELTNTGDGATVKCEANNVEIHNNSINSTFEISDDNTTIYSAGSNTKIHIKEGTQNTTIFVRNDYNPNRKTRMLYNNNEDLQNDIKIIEQFDNKTTINLPNNYETKVTVTLICKNHLPEFPTIKIIKDGEEDHNFEIKYQYEGEDFLQDDNDQLKEMHQQHKQHMKSKKLITQDTNTKEAQKKTTQNFSNEELVVYTPEEYKQLSEDY